eukprot:TRINITY_DN5094_c0_g1_i2.p1 TRINITY_DN5094_c0_g1~~TRINITY_DN5094_c0_g1_i2.p1  ORF type:complete len:443 (-),score=31.09 TRINITY_DN5094_c0_g1_i2:83-1411(-)
MQFSIPSHKFSLGKTTPTNSQRFQEFGCKSHSFKRCHLRLVVQARQSRTPDGQSNDKIFQNNNFSRWLTRYLGLSKHEVSKVSRFEQIFAHDQFKYQAKVDMLRRQLSIDRDEVGRMLVKFPQLFGLSDGNLEKKLCYWLEQVGAKPNLIASYPAVLSRSISSCKETVQFLKMLGVNHPVKLIRKFPVVTSLRRDGLKLKINNLAEVLDMDQDKVCEIVEECPQILGLKDQTIRHKFKELRKVLKADEADIIQQAIWRQPQLLCLDTDTLKKSVEWFVSKGISKRGLEGIVRYAPTSLMLSNERKEQNWRNLLKMGVKEEIVVKVFSMQGTYFGINWTGKTQMLKVQFAKDYLGLNVEQVLISCPMFFTCSLMQRIAPRVIYLKQNNGNMTNKTYLITALTPSNQDFEKKYNGYIRFQKQFQKEQWPQVQLDLETSLLTKCK